MVRGEASPLVTVLIIVSLPSVYHAVNLMLFGRDGLSVFMCKNCLLFLIFSLVNHVNWLVPRSKCRILIYSSSSLWCHFVASTGIGVCVLFAKRPDDSKREKGVLSSSTSLFPQHRIFLPHSDIFWMAPMAITQSENSEVTKPGIGLPIWALDSLQLNSNCLSSEVSLFS